MKKLNLLFITGLLSVSFLNAQNITDALRYSQNEIQGTARYRALSGAFGALGGDMSAVSANPASSAIFTQSHASFSGVFSNTDNNTRYFNGMGSSSDSNFDINQGGAAFVFTSNKSRWKKFSMGVAYERTNNYDDNWYATGTNTKDDVFVDNNDIIKSPANSIAGYFFLNADGLEKLIFTPTGQELVNHFNITNSQALNDPEQFFDNNYQLYHELGYQFLGEVESFGAQQAFLGYQGYLFDSDSNDESNKSYTTNVAQGNFNHDYTYASTGYNGKIAFNFATQYDENLYLGLNLNSHFINYNKSTNLIERNSNGGTINFIEFENNLATRGSGFSFQLGGIVKITNELRAGLTYDSPIWYSIEEETSQYLGTNGSVSINPQVVNVYPKYKLQTPSKITGSLAYIFGTQGLISFDYSHKDYSATKLKPTSDPDFQLQNTNMNDKLQAASTYRVGGEYKIQQFSFRGGYRFEESPYKDGVTIGDLNGYSVGLGYNFGNTRLDVTYDQYKRDYNTPLYSVGLTDSASIDNKNSNVTLSLSFNI